MYEREEITTNFIVFMKFYLGEIEGRVNDGARNVESEYLQVTKRKMVDKMISLSYADMQMTK
jgi:hypothetical protein